MGYTPTTEEGKMIGLTWDEVNELVLKARETERERIIAVIRETILDDDGEGLTVRDEDGMNLILNVEGLIRIIKGEEQ